MESVGYVLMEQMVTTRRIESGGVILIESNRYLVKLYIDQTGELEKDFRAKLGDDEFVG